MWLSSNCAAFWLEKASLYTKAIKLLTCVLNAAISLSWASHLAWSERFTCLSSWFSFAFIPYNVDLISSISFACLATLSYNSAFLFLRLLPSFLGSISALATLALFSKSSPNGSLISSKGVGSWWSREFSVESLRVLRAEIFLLDDRGSCRLRLSERWVKLVWCVL